MTSRKIADLKVADLGDVIVNSMECHLVLKRHSCCRSNRRHVAWTVTYSIWLHDLRGMNSVSQLIAELLLASLFVISELKKR
jgi:hypothetical protein